MIQFETLSLSGLKSTGMLARLPLSSIKSTVMSLILMSPSQQLAERELCSATTYQQKVRSDVSTLNNRRKQVLYVGEESEITIELVDQVYFFDNLLVFYVSLRSLEQNQSKTNTLFGNISFIYGNIPHSFDQLSITMVFAERL